LEHAVAADDVHDAMKFTVTSKAGVTEVIDVLQARGPPLNLSWRCSGAREPTFASLMRTAGVEAQRIYAGWQPTRLQCCQMNKGWASEPVQGDAPHGFFKSDRRYLVRWRNRR
jgi:hypothetical protein